MPKTQKQIIGGLGEGIVCRYLEDRDFKIVEVNYWKPWGEIDIIAQKNNHTHFIEVKTVTHPVRKKVCSKQTFSNRAGKNLDFVSCGTLNKKDIEKPGFLSFFGEIVPRVTKYLGLNTKKDVPYETVLSKNREVVTHETEKSENFGKNSVSCGTEKEKTLNKIRKIRDKDKYRPEDNLHPWKLKRLSRVIQTYLLENNKKSVSGETLNDDNQLDWQFDIATVYLNIKDKEARVEYLDDIVL